MQCEAFSTNTTNSKAVQGQEIDILGIKDPDILQESDTSVQLDGTCRILGPGATGFPEVRNTCALCWCSACCRDGEIL